MDNQRFSGLIKIQQTIAEARGDLQTVMKAIVDEYSVMPQSNGIVVELRDGDQLYYAAASGTSAGQLGLRLRLNSSLSGLSILTGQPLYCADSHHDARVNRVACDRVGLRSMIVVPIPHRGQTVGVLKFHSDQPDAFDEDDMLLAHLLVGPLVVGLSSVAEEDALRANVDLRLVVEMKEQLVSTVSHEMRTPVTSIASTLALLATGAGGALPDQSRPLIEIAERNALRLRRLVDDLLDIDRLDAGLLPLSLTDVDLRTVLLAVVEENGPYAQKTGVKLELRLPAKAIVIETDKDRLFQAVTNLVSNASKFSPPGSTVVVALARLGDTALIRVSDAGPGVPKEFRSRLFDRFSQAGRQAGPEKLPGTGLGLAIAKGITEQLGGTIRLDTKVASGATFEICLPIAESGRLAATA